MLREERRSTQRARGFTLVEVMVVVAIVGVLAALLLPSLRGAREAARGAVCLSNARQLVVSALTYAGDHGEQMPPGSPDRLSNLTRWHGSRTSAGEAFAPPGGSMTAYLDGADGPRRVIEQGDSVRVCPTFTPTLRVIAAARVGFERSCGGYGYNTAYVGSVRGSGGDGVSVLVSDLAGQRVSRFGDGARTAVFADTALADGNGAAGVIEYSFLEPRFWPDAPDQRADPSVHFRHGGARGERANVAWLDGHASGESLAFSWSSGVYPASARTYRIGWFGEADDNTLMDDR